MNSSFKLLRIYTDEAAYFGDRKVFDAHKALLDAIGDASIVVTSYALFRLEFADRDAMRPAIAGRPVYLAMAMDEGARLKLKPPLTSGMAEP